MTRYGDWIQSVTGKKVYPLDPDPDEIDIQSIAHALGNLCRFGGHTRMFYSVAEHSCHVHDFLPAEFKLAGLMHDAAEAFLIDLPRPLKCSPGFERYAGYEDCLMQVIAAKFGFTWPMPRAVESADEALLVAEVYALMSPRHQDWPALPLIEPNIRIRCWTPEHARREFMLRYEALS